MFVSPLFRRELVLLQWSYHVERYNAVKRHICAVLSEMWYKNVFWFLLWFRKVCSNGVIRYEVFGTGSRFSGENVEKSARFQVKKLKWYAVFNLRKKAPRARDAESGSFENGALVSSAKISPGNKEKTICEDSRKCQPMFLFPINFSLDRIR
ncbi:hypothetical protein V144x_53220 [Gimesia aquarii]|uniref:Uncharacterized protein n=1 Tax=Gimesia aquarii TaxID=2527964 RepID=A0A517W3H1_9PLAN|nr:hypothetical protein V144x_53220 [Gimesia aquarii]